MDDLSQRIFVEAAHDSAVTGLCTTICMTQLSNVFLHGLKTLFGRVDLVLLQTLLRQHAVQFVPSHGLNSSGRFVVLSYITGSVALLGVVGIQDLEAAAQPDAFGTISDSMWWMIVTMTTVGYGDVSPQTPEGKLFAMILMPITLGIMGAVIGIVGGAFADAEIDEVKEEVA